MMNAKHMPKDEAEEILFAYRDSLEEYKKAITADISVPSKWELISLKIEF